MMHLGKTVCPRRVRWACVSLGILFLAGCNNDPGPPPKGAPTLDEVKEIDIDISPPADSPKESSGDPAKAPTGETDTPPAGSKEK